MNLDAVRAVANAVLYEGYMLYPYRASALKNRSQGWSFGTLLPPAYVAEEPGEADALQGQVLVTGGEDALLTVEARFLQLGQSAPQVIERSVTAQRHVSEILRHSYQKTFSFDTEQSVQCHRVTGEVELRAEEVDSALRLTVRLKNQTPLQTPVSNRDLVLFDALVAAHALVTAEGGEFASLLDPPEELRVAASACRQVGVFPVLAGSEDEHAAMLLSPIILYDYPKIAQQSRGDFCDSSEIDEMLSLRVLTLSDAEKNEIRAAGGRASEILERTEALSPDELSSLHGMMYQLARSGETS
jgi:hypothetical protein